MKGSSYHQVIKEANINIEQPSLKWPADLFLAWGLSLAAQGTYTTPYKNSSKY